MDKKLGTIAVQHFDGGYNCAESLALAMSERLGISSELIPKIATGLGAGMGRCGHACGAYTGALLALGMKFGRKVPGDDRDRIYDAAKELELRFIEKFGAIDCLALIGFDIRTLDGLKAAKDSGVFETKCREFVRYAADTAAELAGV